MKREWSLALAGAHAALSVFVLGAAIVAMIDHRPIALAFMLLGIYCGAGAGACVGKALER